MAARMQYQDKPCLLYAGVRVRQSFCCAPMLPSPHLECLEGDMDLLAVSPEPRASASPLALSKSDHKIPACTSRARQRRSVTFAAENAVQLDSTDASPSAFNPAPARTSQRLSSDTRHISWADSRPVPGSDGDDQQPKRTSLSLQHGGVLTTAALQLSDEIDGAEVRFLRVPSLEHSSSKLVHCGRRCCP
jgi:hypothetical protein